MEFESFGKIARLSRLCTITEKIDGTNAQIYITDDDQFLIGSRNKYITPEDDNAGFAKWAMANKEELLQLGYGRHYGEWWGKGIQRGYEQKEKQFSLFNTHKWGNHRPSCCGVVPVLYEGIFDTPAVEFALNSLRTLGSYAAPGFKKPEGIMIYHQAAGIYFKKTLEKDESPKGLVE